MELLLRTSAGFLPCALFHEKKVVLAPQTRGKYTLSQGLRYVCSQWLAEIAYLLYLMCSSGRTSTLTSYSREQQKKSKMHLPRIDSFLLKSMFLTLSWAHKDGCWVRMNQKCGCHFSWWELHLHTPGGSSTAQLCGHAAAQTRVPGFVRKPVLSRQSAVSGCISVTHESLTQLENT